MDPGAAALSELRAELKEAYNELKAQQVHAECEAAEMAARMRKSLWTEAQELHPEPHRDFCAVEASAAEAISAAEESAAEASAVAHQLREELVDAQEELVEAQEDAEGWNQCFVQECGLLGIEQRYFAEESTGNVELRQLVELNNWQTRAMLGHQCWGHMENI